MYATIHFEARDATGEVLLIWSWSLMDSVWRWGRTRMETVM